MENFKILESEVRYVSYFTDGVESYSFAEGMPDQLDAYGVYYRDQDYLLTHLLDFDIPNLSKANHLANLVKGKTVQEAEDIMIAMAIFDNLPEVG